MNGIPCLVCGVPSTRHCSRCQDASYCSREHQIEHWKSHKNSTCLSAHGKKMPADVDAEKSFPSWIQWQFESGRKDHEHMQQMLRLCLPAGKEPPSTGALRLTNRPKHFSGSRKQALRNLASHDWPDKPLDGDPISTRCIRCQAKFVHAAAFYPCGQSPPRILAGAMT